MSSSPAPSPSPERVLKGFAWFMILLGLALGSFGTWFIRTASESKSWPEAEGTVRSTRVRWSTSSSDSNKMNPTRRYHYEVTYRYEVDGVEYKNDRYSLGTGPRVGKTYRSDQEARTAASQAYPFGSKVKVAYDPANPSSSVLSSGLNGGTFAPLILGIFFTACGVLFKKAAAKSNSLAPAVPVES